MNTKVCILAVVAGLAALAGCRREDWREVTLEVPGLTRDSKAKVESALSRYSGVDKGSYKFDFDKRILTLRYDSMQCAQTNLRMAIEEKGVEVTFPTNTTGHAGYINTRK